jgi:hypothetical protein
MCPRLRIVAVSMERLPIAPPAFPYSPTRGLLPVGPLCALPRFRTLALHQRVLKICVEEFMSYRTQKAKELLRFLGTCNDLLLFRAQRGRRGPHTRLLKVRGSRCSSTYPITHIPSLSTLYDPLPKQLISVLGHSGASQGGDYLREPGHDARHAIIVDLIRRVLPGVIGEIAKQRCVGHHHPRVPLLPEGPVV